MSDTDDRRLLSLLDSLSPEHVERLKAQLQDPSAGGPATYRGVDVPAYMRPHWNSPQAMWWRAGVEATRQTAEPLLLALADTKPCEFDSLGACLTHDYPPPLCADGEARKFIAAGRGRT